MTRFFSIFGLAITTIAFTVQAATVSGTVNFKGTAPKRKRIRMSADPICNKLNKTPVFSEKTVVNKNNTLRNVFVYVKEGLEKKSYPVPKESIVVFDQQGCKYSPHVFGIRTGQTLEIRNSDPTLHNVHVMPKKNPQFNVGMPIKGMKISRKFDTPEIGAKIKCDVHPWMRAYANIMDHPFFSVTGEKGAFEIKDLSPGKYVFAAWHEKYGTRNVNVTVADGKPTNVTFNFNSMKK